MRDLNLGPDSKHLVQNYRALSKGKPTDGSDPINMVASEMALMLERWINVAWCWPDACPATICGGPHVKVKYHPDAMPNTGKPVEVIEPANKVGQTFPEVPYHVITD
jgi:hypothetical protein